MQIEIITIGDEIVSGNIVNSNVVYLSDQLWLKGLEVSYHTSVRDDVKKIKEVLMLAQSRADVVIVSGGLGPTADDFTIEVAAKAFRKKLVYDTKYLQYLNNIFKQWGRPISENNKKQALIPQGAKTFQNRVGTAPGISLKYKKVQFYFLPGVPKELKQLFDDFILPDILSQQKEKKHFCSKILKCFGATESELDCALQDLYVNRFNIQDVRIGFRAQFPETFIKLSAWNEDEREAQKLLKLAEDKIREKIGRFIYGEGEDTLESVIGHYLKKMKKTVATAESCTGGLISHRITNVPGASGYFKNSVVTYSDEAKISVLGVSPGVIKSYGAVSSQCAIEMAQGVRRLSKADYGIAVTGIAGPTGGTSSKPVGTVHIALATHNGTKEKRYHLPRNREWFKLLTSSMALEQLRRELVEGEKVSLKVAS